MRESDLHAINDHAVCPWGEGEGRRTQCFFKIIDDFDSDFDFDFDFDPTGYGSTQKYRVQLQLFSDDIL